MTLPHQWHGEGETLVLLAGLGAKGTSWRPFLERAARQYRVLTFDLPGSGCAPSLGGPTSIRQLAIAALELLDELGVEHARLVGRSMGGMVAQELALAAPRRIRRLGLICTTGHCDVHLSSVFELWARMAEAGVPAKLRHQSSLLWCLGHGALARQERARAYLEARSSHDRPADYARQARACAAHDALDRLSALRMPTLVLAGGDDRLTPPHHAEALVKTIRDARLAHVSGSGHLAYLEQPERFADEVLGFLAEEAA